ncbi:MAG: hypothetical protein M9938_02685 [Solirubrobacterales bacterium]|nr:hypothetical protein [Solirubrobacterales bacterium]
MLIPVSFFVALALAIFSYSQGQGGPVAGLVFFGVLFIGVLVHVTKPLIMKVRPIDPEGRPEE